LKTAKKKSWQENGKEVSCQEEMGDFSFTDPYKTKKLPCTLFSLDDKLSPFIVQPLAKEWGQESLWLIAH
jgi:hypothetical protein